MDRGSSEKENVAPFSESSGSGTGEESQSVPSFLFRLLLYFLLTTAIIGRKNRT